MREAKTDPLDQLEKGDHLENKDHLGSQDQEVHQEFQEKMDFLATLVNVENLVFKVKLGLQDRWVL